MSQHTPGTWASSRHATPAAFPQFGIYSEGGNGHDLACVMSHGTSDPTETEANARLMAAAPDLLAALQDVRAAYQAMFDIMPVAWQTLDDICAQAIAKATEDSTHA